MKIYIGLPKNHPPTLIAEKATKREVENCSLVKIQTDINHPCQSILTKS